MLETLRIQNFKSWRDTGTIQFGALTGFFGTNSSGKTSILQFLLMLKQTVESSDRARVLNLGDEKSYVELGILPDVIHNHNLSKTIEFELEYRSLDSITLPKGRQGGFSPHNYYTEPIKLSSAIKQQEGYITIPHFEYTLKNIRNNVSAHVGVRRKDNSDNNEATSFYELEHDNIELIIDEQDLAKVRIRTLDTLYLFPSILLYGVLNFDFLNELALTFEQALKNTYYLGPLRDYPKRRYSWAGGKVKGVGNRGEDVIAALLSSRQEGPTIHIAKNQPNQTVEQYVAYWLHRMKLIESFQVKTISANLYEVRVKRTSESTEVLITDVGFGVSQLLPVLVLLFYVPEGSTIILEQPEIHLHPAVQAGLADVMLDAIKRRNVQIILESHSEHLLQRLQTRLAEEVLPADKVKLYFTKFEKEASEMTALDLDEYGNIRNWPKNFFGDQFGEAAARMRAEIKHKQGEGKQ